jgi:membrane protein implicated in regulation of membrane protease activity
MPNLPTARDVWHSVALRPVTTVYLLAVAAIMAITSGWVSLPVGVIALGFLTVLLILLSVLVELRKVHHLVNARSDAQDERIGQLIEALHEGGVTVPEPKGSP